MDVVVGFETIVVDIVVVLSGVVADTEVDVEGLITEVDDVGDEEEQPPKIKGTIMMRTKGIKYFFKSDSLRILYLRNTLTVRSWGSLLIILYN